MNIEGQRRRAIDATGFGVVDETSIVLAHEQIVAAVREALADIGRAGVVTLTKDEALVLLRHR